MERYRVVAQTHYEKHAEELIALLEAAQILAIIVHNTAPTLAQGHALFRIMVTESTYGHAHCLIGRNDWKTAANHA